MLEFLLWCGIASVGASLALAVVAWIGRCRCAACEPVRWRLTRPALDSAPILHRSSSDAEHDIRFIPYGQAAAADTVRASPLYRIQSQGRGHRTTGGPVQVLDFVGNDGPEMFIPFKRHHK